MVEPDTPLAQSEFPPDWISLLVPHGYETVEQFLSTCRVEGGLEALSRALGVLPEEVRRESDALMDEFSFDQARFEPSEHPTGALDD